MKSWLNISWKANAQWCRYSLLGSALSFFLLLTFIFGRRPPNARLPLREFTRHPTVFLTRRRRKKHWLDGSHGRSTLNRQNTSSIIADAAFIAFRWPQNPTAAAEILIRQAETAVWAWRTCRAVGVMWFRQGRSYFHSTRVSDRGGILFFLRQARKRRWSSATSIVSASLLHCPHCCSNHASVPALWITCARLPGLEGVESSSKERVQKVKAPSTSFFPFHLWWNLSILSMEVCNAEGIGCKVWQHGPHILSWSNGVQFGICPGFSYGSFATSTLCSTFHKFFSKSIEVDLVLLPDFRLFPGATHNLQDLDSLICGRPAVVWQQDDSTLVCRGCLPSATQSASLHVDCCSVCWDVA